MVQACPAEHAIYHHSYICADFLAQSGNCVIVLVVIFVLDLLITVEQALDHQTWGRVK